MSPETKAKALEKLAAFDVQIGYPKKWKDYSNLAVRADDLYGDVERGVAWGWNYDVSRLNLPVDRDEWGMTPQTVNAYNQPTFNEVVFPAAILQPPVFDAHADPAVNYGAIGAVIGHEMSHGFDDQGRKFDLHGQLTDWWTPTDAERFVAASKIYGAEYERFPILEGAHINGALTMGENIADLGGILAAFDAYHASLHGKPAPVARLRMGWPRAWMTPGISSSPVRFLISTRKSIGRNRGSWILVIVLMNTVNMPDPGSASWPERMVSSACRWASSARSSTIGRASPSPSWMALGQANRPAQTSPSSLTSPKWPRSIRIATAARQLPKVGRPLNWHGHPQLQLQAASSGPVSRQST